jgi:hypothetical protein
MGSPLLGHPNSQLDQRGQALTEYVVLLAVIVGIFTTVFKAWVGPTLAKLTTRVTQNMEKQLMKADLHYFPVGR